MQSLVYPQIPQPFARAPSFCPFAVDDLFELCTTPKNRSSSQPTLFTALGTPTGSRVPQHYLSPAQPSKWTPKRALNFDDGHPGPAACLSPMQEPTVGSMLALCHRSPRTSLTLKPGGVCIST